MCEWELAEVGPWDKSHLEASYVEVPGIHQQLAQATYTSQRNGYQSIDLVDGTLMSMNSFVQ